MNYWMPFTPQLNCTLKPMPPTVNCTISSFIRGSSTPQLHFEHFDVGCLSASILQNLGPAARLTHALRVRHREVSTESLQPKWRFPPQRNYAGGLSSLSSAASSRPSSTNCVRVGSSFTLMHSMVASIALVLSSTADVAMASSMTVG